MIFYILPMLLMISCGNQGNTNAYDKNVRSSKDVELIKDLQEEVTKLNKDIETLKSNDTDSLNNNLLKVEERAKSLEEALRVKEEELKVITLENNNLKEEVNNLKTTIDSKTDALRAASQQSSSASSQNGLEGEAFDFYKNFIQVKAFETISFQMYEYLLDNKTDWKDGFKTKKFNIEVSKGLIERSGYKATSDKMYDMYDLNLLELFITFPTDPTDGGNNESGIICKLFDSIDALKKMAEGEMKGTLEQLFKKVYYGDKETVKNNGCSIFAVVRHICRESNIKHTTS